MSSENGARCSTARLERRSHQPSRVRESHWGLKLRSIEAQRPGRLPMRIAAVLISPWLQRRQRLVDAMRGVLSTLMANRNYVVAVLLTPILLTSCETMSPSALPSSFTTENIMKVHPGMSSGEIQRLFGEPKSISSAVCGRPPNQWTCTTWEYGEFPYDRASFTFSGDHGSYILNNFDVDRD
jgi:hypothetical protein